MNGKECLVCKKNRAEWGKKVKSKTKTCSKDCYLVLMRSIQRDPIMRANASATRKNYLKNNPENHFWRERSSNRSVPCEVFKEQLRMRGIEFVEEHYPLEDRFFRIDVAFPEHKLGIEINGSQHYKMGSSQLTDYYQDRHNIIESNGWKLIEVYHRHVWDSNKVDELVNIIEEAFNGDDLSFYSKFERPKTKKQIAAELRKERQKAKSLQPGSEKLEMYRKAIEEADPKKWGWTTRAATKLGISHTHVRRIANKHFTELL